MTTIYGPSPPVSLLVLVLWLSAACGGGRDVAPDAEEDGGLVPGDSLNPPPAGAPAAPVEGDPESASGRAETTGFALGPACDADAKSPERLDLSTSWEGDQVRVTGGVAGGAGHALSLGLSQAGHFVYDRVFKADLMGVITLEDDALDLTTVTNEPSDSERAAFARTGAAPLEASLPVCLDALLYEKGSLDLLAVRHLQVEGSPEGASP